MFSNGDVVQVVAPHHLYYALVGQIVRRRELDGKWLVKFSWAATNTIKRVWFAGDDLRKL